MNNKWDIAVTQGGTYLYLGTNYVPIPTPGDPSTTDGIYEAQGRIRFTKDELECFIEVLEKFHDIMI